MDLPEEVKASFWYVNDSLRREDQLVSPDVALVRTFSGRSLGLPYRLLLCIAILTISRALSKRNSGKRALRSVGSRLLECLLLLLDEIPGKCQ